VFGTCIWTGSTKKQKLLKVLLNGLAILNGHVGLPLPFLMAILVTAAEFFGATSAEI
jgi:hypothetical protein